MNPQFTDQDNASLDAVIMARRSERVFQPRGVSSADIDAVIKSGLYAPYGGLANGTADDFRRFFVFSQSGGQLPKLHTIIRDNAAAGALILQRQSAHDPARAEKAMPFIKRMQSLAENGIPGFETAPCCIIIAERKGVPPVEKQALAHVIENMWQKATALNLGLRLVSAIGGLAENEDFCKLLDLNPGEFAVEGCLIGYPAGETANRLRPQKIVTRL